MLRRPEGWTKEDNRAWTSLNRRFPGLAADAERAVMRMAVSLGHGAKTRVRYDHRGPGYVAFIEAVSPVLDPSLNPVSYPVIPDEFNPAQGKRITQEMEPHIFTDLAACRKAAEEAEGEFLRALKEVEAEAMGEPRRE